jgi:hypothetical protein
MMREVILCLDVWFCQVCGGQGAPKSAVKSRVVKKEFYQVFGRLPPQRMAVKSQQFLERVK